MAPARTPVVLMRDLTLVRPLVMARIPFVLVTDDAQDVTLRSASSSDTSSSPATRRMRGLQTFALALADGDVAWALHDKATFYARCEALDIVAPRTLHEDEDPDTARL